MNWKGKETKRECVPRAATRTRPPRLRGARAQLQRLRRSPRNLNGRPPRTRALTMAALRASCGLTRLLAAAPAEPLKSSDPGLPQRIGRRGEGSARKKDGGRGTSAPFSSALEQASCTGSPLFTSESLDNYDLTLLLGLEVMKKKKRRLTARDSINRQDRAATMAAPERKMASDALPFRSRGPQ